MQIVPIYIYYSHHCVNTSLCRYATILVPTTHLWDRGNGNEDYFEFSLLKTFYNGTRAVQNMRVTEYLIDYCIFEYYLPNSNTHMENPESER